MATAFFIYSAADRLQLEAIRKRAHVVQSRSLQVQPGRLIKRGSRAEQ